MSTITCPTDCSLENLPVVAFDDCAPKVLSSEIQALYIGRKHAIAFTDVTLALEWTDRISNSLVPPVGSTVDVKDLLRPLTVIGDMAAPNSTTREISGNRTVVTKKTYTLNFEIDDVTDANWQFAQKIQCGKGSYPLRVWAISKSGHVIGGNAGILGKMNIDHILDRGADGIMRLVGTVSFDADIFPNRDAFPLAA
jgi:hypothetical protein